MQTENIRVVTHSCTETFRLTDKMQASSGLSETERKMLRLILLGYSNREIGEALNYSYTYVRKVVNVIYEKKFVSSRADLKKLLR